jgi:hypothetical protein
MISRLPVTGFTEQPTRNSTESNGKFFKNCMKLPQIGYALSIQARGVSGSRHEAADNIKQHLYSQLTAT